MKAEDKAVKERPILFSGEMVRAIIDGRKSMTRRVMKPQPELKNVYTQYVQDRGIACVESNRPEFQSGVITSYCPYGQPGDRLWVRETYCLECSYEYPGGNLPTDGRPIKIIENDADGRYEIWPHYRATEPDVEIMEEDQELNDFKGTRWKPSIFMPRWASRITLEIVSVKVERIQDITEADSISEGMPKRSYVFETPAKAFFRSLWNELNSKRGFGWDVNPWVWVIEFRRIKP